MSVKLLSNRLLLLVFQLVFSGHLLASAPVIKIHFTVFTNNEKARQIATIDVLKNEIVTLNKNFVSKKGEQLVNFQFGSLTSFEDVQKSKDEIITYASSNTPIDQWKRKIKSCIDPDLMVPNMVNVFITDAISDKKGDAETKSYGYHSAFKPYILLDYCQLKSGGKVFFHEMGHAFGLNHLCATANSKNIMSDQSICSNTNINDEVEKNPLTDEQINKIKENASLYAKNFGMYDPAKNIQNADFENLLVFWDFSPQRYRTPGKSGKYSAYLKKTETLSQSFKCGENGNYTLSVFFYNPEGSSEFGVKINGKNIQKSDVKLSPANKFSEQTISNITVKKGDLVTLFVTCKDGKVYADDFTFKK